MTGAFQEWQERRARLNHDFLCNRLITQMVALEGTAIPDEEDLVALRQWRRRHGDYVALLADAPGALSTARLLDDSLLNGLGSEDREGVRRTAHALFLGGSGLTGALEEIRRDLDALDTAIAEYLALPGDRRDPSLARSLTDLARRLSDRLSRLPMPARPESE